MKPKFTIAIPAYNLPEYLKQAIHSCLKQTISDFEIVVSDDCSAEDLGTIAKSFDDPRIKYYRNTQRLGATANFQRSVSLSSGEYIVNLNCDDLLLPNYLEMTGAALDERTVAAAVYSVAMRVKGKTVIGWHNMPKVPFASHKEYVDHPWLEKFHNVGPTCCLFRRSAFERIGGYRVSLRFAADWDLFMRFMSVAGGVVFLPTILSIARKHDRQMTKVSTPDGVQDILDLWKMDEYSHWPAWEIAHLALTQTSAGVRSGRSRFEVLQQIRQRGLVIRIIRGMPRALYAKAIARMRPADVVDINYLPPANVDEAVRAASALIGS